MFYCIIKNGEVIITGIKDISATEIVIPETIDDYPVTRINVGSFTRDNPIDSINNIKVVNGFCVINNRWFYYYENGFGDIHNIVYEVGGDYYCNFTDIFSVYKTPNTYLINKVLYHINFKL